EFAAAANEFYAVYDLDCDADPAVELTERPGGTCVRSAAMAGLPEGVLWAQPSLDFSSSGTGSSVFDFNGDGRAEAVYGDECYVRVYDGTDGTVLFSSPASNGTGFELPIIADADGDFATEIVVARTTKSGCPGMDPIFAGGDAHVQQDGFVILRDPEDRWASSRPIWNQHAYSVSHVTDDGQVVQTSSWDQNWTVP
ncbi:MAG: VCBS repeat-containing protein, partial [Actinobacteria bacterium]|nr:VCBS repeat-containing protein [Actinomycetota bacterium]